MAKTMRTRIIGIALLLCFLLTGCGKKLDPSDPEGAFNLFWQHMMDGQSEAMWDLMAPSSHEYFDQQLERLHEMDEKIGRYLPPTDHTLARKQAGSILTDEIKDGRGLFLKIFKPAEVPKEEAIQVGMQVEQVTMSEDQKSAAVLTRGGQKVLLTYDQANEKWEVMFVESFAELGTAMGWLESNETALDQTIEDLISEERRERESLIAELMGYEEESAN